MTDTGLVAADHITVGYRRDQTILEDYSLSVDAGSTLALVGPSGSGKSTLLFVLAGLIRPRSGVVHLAGQPISTLSERDRSRHRARTVGFVFQDAMLDPSRRTLDLVTEVPVYAGADRRDVVPRARALLDDLGVGQLADRKPGQISGGQAQRIAVARALLTKPTIVFADEPTANLDAASAEVVLDALTRHVRAVHGVLILATHSADVAARLDCVESL